MKLPDIGGGEKRDVSLYVEKLVYYFENECQVFLNLVYGRELLISAVIREISNSSCD